MNPLHAAKEVKSGILERSKVMFETDYFAKALLFLLNNMPVKELFHPNDPKIEEHAITVARKWSKAFMTAPSEHMHSLWSWENEAEVEDLDEKLEFPILLAILGSAAFIIKILNEDGDYEQLDFSPISGRTLLAMGSLHTGAKSYEELVEVAAKGSSSNLDVLCSYLHLGADDAYSGFNMDMEVFTCGHAVGKDLDSFTREDRAAAAISLVAESIATNAHQWAHICNVKHVYFCGGLPNSPVVREKLEKYFCARARRYTLGSYVVQPHFIKLGAYLGVLGALLENLGAKSSSLITNV